jgi:predicted dienelactone hydrolase
VIRGILRAVATLVGLGTGVAATAATAATAAPGFQQVNIPVPGDVPLATGIWYPSDSPAAAHDFGPHQAMLAVNGAINGTGLPLVVISHGAASNYAALFPTAIALAEAGFVVAAVTHTGDSHEDHSRRLEVIDRPLAMKRLVDYMLNEWPQRRVIDAAHIGILGYSAGAFTALVSIGGNPDLRRIAPHCEANPHDPICRFVRGSDVDAYELNDGTGKIWAHDDRITAAVLAAPALAFVFGRDGLANVKVPIQLWRGDKDASLPEPFYAETLLRDLPAKPEYHVVRRGNHQAFAPPCAPGMAATHPMLCDDPPGFDRAAFNKVFNADVVRFFRAQFGLTP